EDEDSRDIADALYGIIFMGTPHKGSDFATWGEFLRRWLGRVKQTNTKLLKELEKNAEPLAELQDRFQKFLRLQEQHKTNIQIVCFLEELPELGLKRKIVLDESSIMRGYASYSIPATHSGMTKYSEPGDVGYMRLKSFLKSWTEIMGTGRQSERQKPKEQESAAQTPKSSDYTVIHNGNVHSDANVIYGGHFHGSVNFGRANAS
ncbi:MAG: hypothetical protein Q9157_008881, partial [Trypethelium eluteriae]